VKGFGWNQFKIAWTRNCQDHPIKELAKHLRDILRFELLATIPTEPAGTMKMRKFVLVLGTITDERQMLDTNHFKTGQDIKDVAIKLACEREARDDDMGIYATYQQWDIPKPNELVGRRIYIFWPIKQTGTSRFLGGCWFQGKMTVVVYGYSVKVFWDPMLKKVKISHSPLIYGGGLSGMGGGMISTLNLSIIITMKMLLLMMKTHMS
jgi:hypothetical protein